MAKGARTKRGLVSFGIVVLVIGGLGLLRCDFFASCYEATRVSVGETEDEVRPTLGEPSVGKESGPMNARQGLMIYGDLRIAGAD